jgi:hypothetical protein
MPVRVYISSATEEMRAYREAAIRAIRGAGMEPVYLNDGFDPSPDPNVTLLQLNERYVRSCEVFVGLYGYGGAWQPEQDDPKLISEWEYEWARKANLPCFCYMPGQSSPLGLDQLRAHPRMEFFKQSLARTFPVVWLRDPEQICQHLERQLHGLSVSVFLSYSSKDREFALWLRDQFKKDNIAVWRDGDLIEPGEEWMDQIRHAIDRCHLMVLLLSADALKSKYVTLEIEEFQAAGKKVFPVKIDACAIPQSVSKLQVLDATGDKEAAYFRLKRAVENSLKKT